MQNLFFAVIFFLNALSRPLSTHFNIIHFDFCLKCVIFQNALYHALLLTYDTVVSFIIFFTGEQFSNFLFITFLKKKIVFSYFPHIFDLYIRLYNPDMFRQWCNRDPPDSSEDTEWNKNLRNILTFRNLKIRQFSVNELLGNNTM